MKLFNKEISNKKVVIAAATLAVLLAGGVFAWQYLEKLKGESIDWRGTYEYGEFVLPNQTWAYVLTISKTSNQFDAELDINGFQTLTRIRAVAQERNGNLDIIFDSYRPGNISEVYKKGDLLFSLERLSDSKYKVLWSTLKSNLLTPPVDAAFTKVSSAVSKDETADWKTYTNTGVDFTFRYPSDWQILEDSFYETASGIKGKARGIIVGKDEVDSNNWIRINPRQFQTSLGICEETANNMVCTYSKNPEILRIFNQILSTFKFLTPEELGKPYIRVVSPNGGGVWRTGEAYQIKYETQQVDKVGIAIFLVDQSVSPWRVNDIAKDVSSTAGQLSWMVPSNTLPGTKYKILITGVVEGAKEPYSGTVGLSDESDNYFSIVSLNP